jgi:hypothetical protein
MVADLVAGAAAPSGPFFPARPGKAKMAGVVPPLFPSSLSTPTPSPSAAPDSLSFPLLARSSNDDAMWGRRGCVAHAASALYLGFTGRERDVQ